MLRIHKWLPALAALATVVSLAAPAPARADYKYLILDDNVAVGPVTTVAGNAFSNLNILTTHFNLVLSSSSTNPNPSITSVTSNLSANLNLQIPDTAHTLTLELVSYNISQPTTSPLSGSSTASASATQANSGDKATFQAWGNSSNSSTFPASGATGGQESHTFASGNTASTVLSPDPTTFSLPISGSYSVFQMFTFTLSNTFLGSESAAVQGITTLTAPSSVPEPATLVSALIGLPALGLGWLRRRRKAVVA